MDPKFFDVSDRYFFFQLEKDRLYFKGVGGSEKKTYEVEMKFFKEIVPDKSKYAVRPMHIEFALEKVPAVFSSKLKFSFFHRCSDLLIIRRIVH